MKDSLTFDKNGKELIKKGSLKNGNGNSYFYHGNGVVKTILLVKNGKTLQVVKEQDKNGKPRKKQSTLKNGNGILFIYDEKDEISQVDEYVNGVRKR